MEFRRDINGLRAVAVLLVLLFHFGTPGFSAGFVGVDVFFVISGFLMTGIVLRGLEGGTFSIPGFYRARLVRLYPALLAVTAATLLFGLAFIEPATLETMARHGIAALLFVSNVVFWQEAGYFGAPPDTMWFLHTWSLSVEWQFYIVYPLVMALAFRLLRSRARLFALLLAGFVLSLAASALAGELFPNERLVSADFYLLPTRAWEMLAGGLVVLSPWQAAARGPRFRAALEIAGLAMIGLALPLFSEETPWPSWQALLPVAGAILVLAADAPRSLLASAPLQWIGAASYSTYLWHWPIVASIAYFGLAGPGLAAAALALSLLAGWASYKLIEQPCRRFLKPADPAVRYPGLPRMGALAASLTVVLFAGGAVVAGHGLPQRSGDVAAVYDATLAAAADYGFPLGQCGGTSTFGTRLRPCEVGSPSHGDDVLVIGDSFAEIWFARAREIERRLTGNAVVFVTKGGCPPIADMERAGPGFGCRAFHRMAMEQARGERFGTVILAGMWASYFGREHANATICEAGAPCRPTGTEAGLAAAIRSLAAEIDGLKALGKDVVVLTTSPYPGFDVPAELRKRAFAGRTPPADWSFDFAAVTARAQPVDAALASLADHGARVIDLAGLLCREMVCPATLGMVPLYTDADHLRSSYTALAGDFLDPFLHPRFVTGSTRDEAGGADAAPAL